MSRAKQPPPPPEAQVQLRSGLEEIRSALLGKAVLLVRGLRPPKPEPAELVSETVRRLLARYTDTQVESVSGLAFTTLTRIACDIARKGRRFDGGFIEDDGEVVDPAAPRQPDPFVQNALETLTDRERCIAVRVAIEDLAVPKAFELCKWDTPSPYAEYKKILRKLRTEIEGP